MIESVVGLMNSGKTLYMTYKLFMAYLNGKSIISNYDLAFPHFKINKDWLLKLSQDSDNEFILKNVCFGFDELWIWLDARDAINNRVATYFFLQSSKDDCEIYITAQTNIQNDKRLRNNLHRITTCSRVIILNGKIIEVDNEQRFLPHEYLDKLYIKVVSYKRVNFSYGLSDLIPDKTFYLKADIVFDLYNTRQKII